LTANFDHIHIHHAGRLDAEVLSVTRRVGELLQKLPRDINPVNLEELRRIKQTLVELENKVHRLCVVFVACSCHLLCSAFLKHCRPTG
jgi:hypothetical protein